MPATWVSCRRNRKSSGRIQGYTLIEILVVVVLMGLVAGIATPLGLRALKNAELRAAERKLGVVLDDLPQRAFRQGEALTVLAPALAQEAELGTDQGEIELPQPLRYRADGSAEGGDVVWHRPGGSSLRWHVEALTGRALLQP